MRHSILLSAAIFAIACQPSQPDVTPRAPETTYTRGSSTVTRSDTTRTVTPSPTPGSSEVAISVDRASYARGTDVMVTIVSHSSETLGFNQCSSRTVERQQGSSWVAHPEPGRMCTMELRLLTPHQTQTVRTDLPNDLTAGTYRIAMVFSSQGTGASRSVRAVSGPFRVQ